MMYEVVRNKDARRAQGPYSAIGCHQTGRSTNVAISDFVSTSGCTIDSNHRLKLSVSAHVSDGAKVAVHNGDGLALRCWIYSCEVRSAIDSAILHSVHHDHGIPAKTRSKVNVVSHGAGQTQHEQAGNLQWDISRVIALKVEIAQYSLVNERKGGIIGGGDCTEESVDHIDLELGGLAAHPWEVRFLVQEAIYDTDDLLGYSASALQLNKEDERESASFHFNLLFHNRSCG
mmetsp:Transcript_44368/g.93190  ORF Transcript_44368/g.93190 Transcript_44368/m.93190 type:complete len:231 (-) Transcript_44368:58-750(-)